MEKSETAVLEVTALKSVDIIKSNPPSLHVSADGYVTTSGWTCGMLMPREYVTPPADGIQEFDFVATPPDGIVLQVISKISASGVLPEMPAWVRGVRVVTATNKIDFAFIAAETLFDGAEIAAADDTDAALLVKTVSGKEVEPVLATEIEGALQEARAGQSCRSFTIASVNFPEVKTEWKIKCVLKNPFNDKCITKTKVPVLYRRTSKITLYAQVCVPSDDVLWDAVKDCVEKAVIAGIAVGVVTSGNLAAASAALKAFLISCLKGKFGNIINDIDVNLSRRKVPGAWKPV